MATGQVKRRHELTGKPVLVVDRMGRPQWDRMFENNPRIVREPTPNAQRILNAGGARPYIVGKSATHWAWKRFDLLPGEIYLTHVEKDFGAPLVGNIFIEPNTKVPDSNKRWIWERWQELVNRGGTFIQCGSTGTRRLRGVQFVETADLRMACAVLAVSKAYVGHEGAMHHAAAAFGVPAVVVFGGFISPAVTGYPTHRNLYTGGSELGCGARLPCQHCRDAMEQITVDDVSRNLEEILR